MINRYCTTSKIRQLRLSLLHSCFAKYGRQNTALNTFVILINFCTLAVGNKKVTAKQTAVILIPVLRKAPNVACNAMAPKVRYAIID